LAGSFSAFFFARAAQKRNLAVWFCCAALRKTDLSRVLRWNSACCVVVTLLDVRWFWLGALQTDDITNQ